MRHHGLRKRCRCPPRAWVRCDHDWHLNFLWAGVHHRFSLTRWLGHPLSMPQAAVAAETIRSQIRNWTFARSCRPADPLLTVADLLDRYHQQHEPTRRVTEQLRVILPVIGSRSIHTVTADRIEQFRAARRAAGG